MTGFHSHARSRTGGSGRSSRTNSRSRGLAALAVAALISSFGVQAAVDASPAVADSSTFASGVIRTAGSTQGLNPGTDGQCTWGAAQKWFEASGSYPAMRGDALAWRDSAMAAGYTVVDEPQERSIVVYQPGVAGAGPYGHVAWVDSVSQHADGQWIHVTEMNNTSLGGVGIFNERDGKSVAGMSYILLP